MTLNQRVSQKTCQTRQEGGIISEQPKMKRPNLFHRLYIDDLLRYMLLLLEGIFGQKVFLYDLGHGTIMFGTTCYMTHPVQWGFVTGDVLE